MLFIRKLVLVTTPDGNEISNLVIDSRVCFYQLNQLVCSECGKNVYRKFQNNLCLCESLQLYPTLCDPMN